MTVLCQLEVSVTGRRRGNQWQSVSCNPIEETCHAL